MPIITGPTKAVVAAISPSKAASGDELFLQPGTVVDAEVLAARANLLKIAITGMAIEVLSEVQLQPGTALKLAVSQTPDGIRLAVVDKRSPDQAQRPTASPPPATATNVAPASTARIVAPPIQPTQAPPQSSEPSIAVQAAIVALAARAAAPVQASLSSLFANLPVVVASEAAPPNVKAAALDLLAARQKLTADLSAADLRTAFRSSGVLLEAGLAKGVMPAGAPDMKAALIIFRQILSGWAATGEGKLTVSQQSPPVDPQVPDTGQSPVLNATAKAGDPPTSKTVGMSVQARALPAGGPEVARADRLQGKMADLGGPDGLPLAAQKPTSGELVRRASPSLIPDQPDTAGPASLASERVVSRVAVDQMPVTSKPLLQTGKSDAADAGPKPSASPPLPAPRAAAEPAPPFRGSAPSVQPIALPTITPETPASHLVARLLDQTDGALARQTLLQVASLPERFDAGTVSQPQPRWAFEIPFATSQGTAIAQFEIADDAGGLSEAGAPSRVWRARFTLDIETTGPVHALVSLAGDKTSVRMWAERPDTAAQLRDNARALDNAMREANLEPGDIVVQSGQPPQRAPALAGRFLDRAT